MNSPWPSVDEERLLTLGARYAALRDAARSGARDGGWKTARLLSRCLMFVLGLLAVAAVFSVFELSHTPGAGVVTGVLAIGAAEGLIRSHRLFWSGFEEALWFAGSVALGFQVVESLGHWNGVLPFALLAGITAIAGLRLLNPLLTTLAAAILSLAVADTHGLFGGTPHALQASLYSYGLAVVALGLGATLFRRPSRDRMLDGLVLVMPLVGFLWSLEGHLPFTLATLRHPTLAAVLPVLMPLAFGLLALVTGIRRRTHAPLLSMLVCVVCLSYSLREFTGMPLHWRMLLWGSLALLACLGLDRALRQPRRGVTTQALGPDPESLSLLQVAGAARLGHHDVPEQAPSFHGEGGGFGGGGASGQF